MLFCQGFVKKGFFGFSLRFFLSKDKKVPAFRVRRTTIKYPLLHLQLPRILASSPVSYTHLCFTRLLRNRTPFDNACNFQIFVNPHADTSP